MGRNQFAQCDVTVWCIRAYSHLGSLHVSANRWCNASVFLPNGFYLQKQPLKTKQRTSSNITLQQRSTSNIQEKKHETRMTAAESRPLYMILFVYIFMYCICSCVYIYMCEFMYIFMYIYLYAISCISSCI
jgi:hypothetical protein